MRRFTRVTVITIVPEADLIKIISSYMRVWPDWVYIMLLPELASLPNISRYRLATSNRGAAYHSPLRSL